MSAPDASMDRPLHLSLPDWRTALKRRMKRPRRPDWFWLGFTLIYAALAVWTFALREWFTFASDLAALGYGWWMVTTGRRSIVWRYYGPVLALCVLQIPLQAVIP